MKFTLMGATSIVREGIYVSPSKVVEFDDETSLLEEMNKNPWIRKEDGSLFKAVTIIHGTIQDLYENRNRY